MCVKKLLFTLSFLMIAAVGYAQQPNPDTAVAEMDYYLPEGVSYNASIPTPEEVIGMVPGEWHVGHDQLVYYMRALAEASDRITIEEIGRTYENRPQVVLTITSPSNHGNIDQIRRDHVALTDPEQSQDLSPGEMPIVAYMGYSIHGNEPSGSNASMLVAYHLAAAEGQEIENLLNNSVILLDPSLNPDGLNRFASWVNTHKPKNVVADPNHREYDEAWPGGRTNHYWFDLNRDWMPVQHPVSQARIEMFHRWKPNILTDHHEMGTNSTFFFQPGIPSRTHPLTPQQNQDLTGAIGEFHAELFDSEQRLYYSEEDYDDFYYGKGSTYPDINGGIGILFEQASSRGHAQESVHGVLRFPFTIKNQFLASLSTMEAMRNLRTEILEYQRNFFSEGRNEGAEADIRAYVFGTADDKGRTWHLAEMLRRHQIETYELAETVESDGETFEAGSSYIIPADQNQYRFVNALFERRTTFEDSLFYDISTWTMPYAFNLPFAELEGGAFSSDLLGAAVEGQPEFPEGRVIGESEDAVAYVFEWDEYYAPRALYRFQDEGVRTKVATVPFSSVTSEGAREFDYGTIMVSIGAQEVDAEKIHGLAQTAAAEDGIEVYALASGHTPEGIDLGSGDFDNLDKPEVAILVGSGTSSSSAGETWHLLDQRFDMTPTLLQTSDVDDDLDRYNVVVMTGGGGISDNGMEELKRWLRQGGTLITTGYAASWAESNGLASFEDVESDDEEEEEEEAPAEPQPYADMSAARGAQGIGGSIFHGKLDLTHPLGYGYNDDDITLFRSGTMFLERSDNPYATPVYYADEPLASGYISDDNLELMGGTASIIVSGYGGGKVITMLDNPNFRAFWYGTNKLFLNGIFFGQTISGGSTN